MRVPVYFKLPTVKSVSYVFGYHTEDSAWEMLARWDLEDLRGRPRKFDIHIRCGDQLAIKYNIDVLRRMDESTTPDVFVGILKELCYVETTEMFDQEMSRFNNYESYHTTIRDRYKHASRKLKLGPIVDK